MKRMCMVLALIMATTAALADDDGVPRPGPTGLSVFANAGAVWADGVNANQVCGLMLLQPFQRDEILFAVFRVKGHVPPARGKRP